MSLKTLFQKYEAAKDYAQISRAIRKTTGLQKVHLAAIRGGIDIATASIFSHNNRIRLCAYDAIGEIISTISRIYDYYYYCLEEKRDEIAYTKVDFEKLGIIVASDRNKANKLAARALGIALGVHICKASNNNAESIHLDKLEEYIMSSDISNKYKKEILRSASRCIYYFTLKKAEASVAFLAENGPASGQYLGEMAYSLIRKKANRDKNINITSEKIIEDTLNGNWAKNLGKYAYDGYDPVIAEMMSITLGAVYEKAEIDNSSIEFTEEGIIAKIK